MTSPTDPTLAVVPAHRPADLPPELHGTRDVRLVVVDMDGTLLDAAHRTHPTLVPLLAELHRRGIVFCAASGRQYATLARQLSPEEVGADPGMYFIAENGAYVVRDGEEVASHGLDQEVVVRLARAVRDLAASGADAGIVVCGKRSAYIERPDADFRTEVARYYARLTPVEDLLVTDASGSERLAVDDEVLKVAVFDFGPVAPTTAPALEAVATGYQVVVSGKHWVDILGATTHKGAALREIQAALGVTPAQTVVFGDYLNDLQMLDAAELSFAMANGHPRVLERARYVAPPNTENGVVRVVAGLLGVGMGELVAAVGQRVSTRAGRRRR